MKTIFSVPGLTALLIAFVWMPVSAIGADFFRGEGTVDTGSFWSGKPSTEQRAAALKAAKLNVWRDWLQRQDPAKVTNIRAQEKRFLDAIEDVIVNVKVVDEAFQEKEKRYIISIKANISEPVVSDMLRAGGGSNATSAAASGGSGEVSVLYLGLARRAASIEREGPETSQTAKADIKTATGGKTSESVKDGIKDGVSGSAQSREEAKLVQQRATTEATTTSSSRTVLRDEKTVYRVGDATNLSGTLGNQLVNAKLNATPYVAAMGQCGLPKPDSFSEVYANSPSGEMPSDLSATLLGNLRACAAQIDGRAYFVWASLTVDAYEKDPTTGFDAVTANLVVQIYDLKRKGFGPATIGSQQKHMKSRASNKEDAYRNALQEAATFAGDTVIQQLRAQGNL